MQGCFRVADGQVNPLHPCNAFVGRSTRLLHPCNAFVGRSTSLLHPCNAFAGRSTSLLHPCNAFAGRSTSLLHPCNAWVGVIPDAPSAMPHAVRAVKDVGMSWIRFIAFYFSTANIVFSIETCKHFPQFFTNLDFVRWIPVKIRFRLSQIFGCLDNNLYFCNVK